MAALDVLFILAHQDDEVGAIPTLAREVRNGNRCWLLYLTDGGESASPAVRDSETQLVVRRIGGDAARASFLSDSAGRIPDGELLSNLPRAAAMLRDWIKTTGVVPARTYTIDWEGGHVDHDAAHLIALSLLKMGTSLKCFSLYNAYRRPPKLFRVRSLVPAEGATESFSVPWRTALTASCAPLWYPSQRRTWIALGPGFVVRTLISRRELLREASLARVGKRPHKGKLLYETLFNVSYEFFESTSSCFRSSLY